VGGVAGAYNVMVRRFEGKRGMKNKINWEKQE
jgi:hypothetical protein